jgi:hypothetical protein
MLVDGFNHLEKYESQWKGLSHILWTIKNIPNHQPEYGCFFNAQPLFKSFDDVSMAKITVSQYKPSFTTTWQILDEPCKQE